MKIRFEIFVPLCFLVIALIIASCIYKDYGLHTDSQAQRADGGRAILCINEKLNYALLSKEKVEDYGARNISQANENGYTSFCELYLGEDKFIGVWFELFLVSGEYLLGLEGTQEIYQFHHLGNHLFFLLGLVFLYQIIRLIIPDYRYALLGSVILYLTPRILAHSFYNTKDIPFLVTYIIAGFTLLKATSGGFKMAVLHGLASAGTVAIRVPGVFVVAVTIGHFMMNFFKKKDSARWIKLVLVFVISFFIGLYLLYPILWEEPLKKLSGSFSFMSNHPLTSSFLFMGEMISTQFNPWYYLPVWFLVTTPLIFTFLFLFILMNSILKIIKYFKGKLKDEDLYTLLVTVLFIGPWIAVIVFDSKVYNAWRHLFFTYPFFVVGVVLAIKKITTILINNKKVKYAFIGLIFFQLINLAYVNIQLHPYQEIYFNNLVDDDIEENFEIDYWGLHYKEAFETILKLEKNEIIKIYPDQYVSAVVNVNMLLPEQKTRIFLTRKKEEADFYFFRYGTVQEKELDNLRMNKENEIFTITRMEIPVMSCFRMK